MSMEHNGGNQNLPSPTLCRMGCGFYGNATFEGMCSKCYKDALKRRQQSTSPTQMAGRVSPSIGTSLASVDLSSNSGSSSLVETSSAAITATSVSLPSSTASSRLDTSTTPSVETATPTVPSVSNPDKTSSQDKEEAVASGAEASPADKDKESSDKDKKPKKNRCHTCKKKVGLTGFECRCGGMYCSLHRYSDKHDCTFNYKEMAQQQIRKNNPVVVGQKIQKI